MSTLNNVLMFYVVTLLLVAALKSPHRTVHCAGNFVLSIRNRIRTELHMFTIAQLSYCPHVVCFNQPDSRRLKWSQQIRAVELKQAHLGQS